MVFKASMAIILQIMMIEWNHFCLINVQFCGINIINTFLIIVKTIIVSIYCQIFSLVDIASRKSLNKTKKYH